MVDSMVTPRSSRSRIRSVKSQPLLRRLPIGLFAGDDKVVRNDPVELFPTLKAKPSWIVSTAEPPSVAIQSKPLKRRVAPVVLLTVQSITVVKLRLPILRTGRATHPR